MSENKERKIIAVEPDDPENIGEFENLLLNFMGGMKPQHLSEREVQLLEEEVGENWFEDMGFSGREECEEPNF